MKININLHIQKVIRLDSMFSVFFMFKQFMLNIHMLIFKCSDVIHSEVIRTVGAIYIGAAKSIGMALFAAILGYLKNLYDFFF
jgi:hypothetical protein